MSLTAGPDGLVLTDGASLVDSEAATTKDPLSPTPINYVAGPHGINAVVKLEEGESVLQADNRSLQTENQRLRQEKNSLRSQIMKLEARASLDFSEVCY